MFYVVLKDTTYVETVYDVKHDNETNQLMFLTYDTLYGWQYIPADDYEPVSARKDFS